MSSDPSVLPQIGPHDWPGDFPMENGQYSCLCCYCLRSFIGHKQRVLCRTCNRLAKPDPPFLVLRTADWYTPRSLLLTIRPATAGRILARRNACVQPIDDEKALELAITIADGLWDINGEAILFWRGGWLRGGQHRLMACVLAGLPLPTYVAFGTE